MAGRLSVFPAVTASTMITQFNFVRKVRCHNGPVEIFLGLARAGMQNPSFLPPPPPAGEYAPCTEKCGRDEALFRFRLTEFPPTRRLTPRAVSAKEISCGFSCSSEFLLRQLWLSRRRA